jgi:peroxiredoxin Q/BCP
MKDLKIGDLAPELSVPDQDGNIVSIGDYKGKKLVLYFYPKDNTPGCTAESCDLRDNYDQFLAKGYEVLGVSPDSQKSHQGFIKKYDLPFSLLSDVEKKVLEAYNSWGEKKMYGKTYMGVLRKTYIIDENGRIENIFEKVDTKAHTKQIFEA